jgi:Leucine-rich repeat (LRR) protein
MNTKLILIILLPCVFFVSCGKKQYPPINQLIVGDSLRLNLSNYKKKAIRFMKSQEAQSLKILSIANATGWVAIGYYTIDGQTNIKAPSLSTVPGWIEATPFIQEIGRIKNLNKLDISLMELKDLPESITELTQLQELNIGFNAIADWDKTIEQLKKLPNLKVLRVYGMRVNKALYERLSSISGTLMVRYTLDEFMEDTANYTEEK